MREIVSIFYKYEFNKINSKIVKNLGWVNSLIEDKAHIKKQKRLGFVFKSLPNEVIGKYFYLFPYL